MENGTNNGWSVNVPALFAGVALIILLTKCTRYLEPSGLYFSFGAFLYSFPQAIGPAALVVKLLVPFVAGSCFALLPFRNLERTAASSGFLAAFILAWPTIVEWDVLAPSELLERRNAFLLVYACYVVGYAYLAKTGCRLVSIYQDWHRAQREKVPHSIGADLVNWERTVKPMLVAVASTLFSLVLGHLFGK